MKAFIRKEAIELLWPVSVLFLAACCAWIAAKPLGVVLIKPQPTICLVVAGIAVTAGALLAFLQFLSERWRGTLGFALHRPGGHGAMFASKAIVGITSTLLLSIGPLFVFAIWNLLFSPNAAVMQAERLLEYTIFGLSGISGWAVGALAAQLRRRWWLDSSVLLFGSLTVYAVSIAVLWSLHVRAESALGIQCVIQALSVAASMTLAYRLLRGARDREQSLPNGQLAALTGLSLIFLLLIVNVLISGIGELARQRILVRMPAVARYRDDGKFRVVDRGSRDLVALMHHDDGREVGGEAAADLVYWPPWPRVWRRPSADGFEPWIEPGQLISGFLPRWTRVCPTQISQDLDAQGRWYSTLAFFDHEAGVVRLFWLAVDVHSSEEARGSDRAPLTVPLQRVFAKDDEGRRFSTSTITAELDQREGFLIDLEDMTLWKVAPMDLASPVTELRLPDGDPLVRLERFYSRSSLRLGAFGWATENPLFVGSRASYVWKSGRFEEYSGNLFAANRVVEAPVRGSDIDEYLAMRVHLTSLDPIEPAVEIRDGKGEQTLFTYKFEPDTSLWTVLIQALVLLRPPITCVNSFADDKPELNEDSFAAPNVSAFSEPLLAQGRRPWLLVLNLAVAVLCTVSLVRRMKRHGANHVMIICCAVIVALLGVIAYVYFRGLMPKRAALLASSAPSTEARALLIQSA